MVILKKIQSATLIEAIVATVLIVVIFAIASLILNNLVLNTFSKKNHSLEYRLNELEYSITNKQIIIPHQELYEDWKILVTKSNNIQDNSVIYFATNTNTNKQIKRVRIYGN